MRAPTSPERNALLPRPCGERAGVRGRREGVPLLGYSPHPNPHPQAEEGVNTADGRAQSALTFPCLITFAQRGISLAIKAPKACGVVGVGMAPSVARARSISGEFNPLLISVL